MLAHGGIQPARGLAGNTFPLPPTAESCDPRMDAGNSQADDVRKLHQVAVVVHARESDPAILIMAPDRYAGWGHPALRSARRHCQSTPAKPIRNAKATAAAKLATPGCLPHQRQIFLAG